MCGIVGMIKNGNDLFNTLSDYKIISKLINKIKHRGKDGYGHFADDKILLGHVRLSVLDLSKRAKQPMKINGYVITYNGEIFNYKELKKELEEDYIFKTESDTEVILYAYKKWGVNCLNKFNGMFAFCIYDMEKNQLFLARDRFGIKPLYYIEKNFIFCSELVPLIPFSEKVIDEEALKQYFNFRFTLNDRTIVKGIKKLEPGHYLIYDLGNKEITKERYYYFKPTFNKKSLREQIEDSVKLRLISDVPVAILLSGGLDSSIITYHAASHNNDKINTFSVGFETTNELPYAKKVAEMFNTNHHEIIITEEDVINNLKDIIMHIDEPIGDPGIIPVYLLSKEVSKYNKVVLSGEGADEIFCGYDRYKLLRYGKYLRYIPFTFGNDILKRIKNMRGKNEAERFFEVIRLFDKEELSKLGIENYDINKIWSYQYGCEITNAQYFDLMTLLPNDFFMKADKMSSAFSLEQRVPFMDYRLVEYAFTLPLNMKLKRWNEKFILKREYKDKLPFIRKKHGFDVPIDYWKLKTILKEYLDKSSHNLYNKEYIYELLNKKYTKNYKLNFYLAQKLFSILVFEMWYSEVFQKNI